MRTLVGLLGNLLIVASLAGLAYLLVEPRLSPSVAARSELPAPRPAPVLAAPPVLTTAPSIGLPVPESDPGDRPPTAPAPMAVAEAASAPVADAQPAPARTEAATWGSADRWLPVTRVAIPSIELEADVVPAPVIFRDGGSTWDVPAFAAGHAEGTAGAGQLGNAVLVGHLTSRRAGNVFEHLERTHVGDLVQLFSGPRRFEYRVVEIRSVERTDASMLATTETPSVSVFTCAGVWLPWLWDYSERLVVRADLIRPPES